MTDEHTLEHPAKPAVILLSGGMDSTVLLHHVAKTLGHAPLHTLSFNYGQRHARELDCAQAQAETVNATHTVLDLTFFGNLVQSGTTLVTGGADVPDLTDVPESDRDQPPTYVPNRNMMLLSIAAAHAEAHHIADIYYGAQAQDEYGYWDCTPDFLQRINATLQLNRKTPVTIHAPFMDYKKEALIPLGTELGVDFGQTWSCYRGGEKPCGTCPTCVERRTAFKNVHAPDPLEA